MPLFWGVTHREETGEGEQRQQIFSNEYCTILKASLESPLTSDYFQLENFPRQSCERMDQYVIFCLCIF